LAANRSKHSAPGVNSKGFLSVSFIKLLTVTFLGQSIFLCRHCRHQQQAESSLRAEDFERGVFKCNKYNQPLFPNTKPSAELIEYCERTQTLMRDPGAIMGVLGTTLSGEVPHR